jgi:hypothetical protein
MEGYRIGALAKQGVEVDCGYSMRGGRLGRKWSAAEEWWADKDAAGSCRYFACVADSGGRLTT